MSYIKDFAWKLTPFARAVFGASEKTVEDTATGNPVTFLTDLAKPLKSLLIPFTPVQSGTGDPSPQNIRPIVPWDGFKVFGSGQNIVTNNFTNGVLDLNTGAKTANPNYIISDYIPVVPLKSYYFKCPTVVSSELDICYYDKDKHYIGYADADGYVSCNAPGRSRKTPAGCYYVRIDTRNAQYNNDICINYPASVTGYVPAVGITETDVVFTSTVYGGEHEAVSGRLMNGWEIIDLGSLEWELHNNTANRQAWKAPITGIKRQSSWSTATQAICDSFKSVSYNSTWIPYVMAQTTEGNEMYFCVESNAYASAEEFGQAMTGKKLCYPLASPVLITTLTPQQINAIKGNNTIWSDANGSMTCVYLVSSKYADEHPVGGLGFGFGFGRGTPNEPDDPENPDEPEEPDIDDSENNQTEGEEP